MFPSDILTTDADHSFTVYRIILNLYTFNGGAVKKKIIIDNFKL